MARKRQARRCSARNRRGQQCGRYAIRGGFVCHVHGGASPRVRDAARRRLMDEAAWRVLAAGCRDGRIGPRRPDSYLPPNRPERDRDARQEAERRRADADPARRELREALAGVLRARTGW